MKKFFSLKYGITYLMVVGGLITTIVLSSCSILFGSGENSARETQLKDTELSLRVQETLIAQQGAQASPEPQQSEENTPEAQQAPTEDIEATNEAVAQQTWGAINANLTATAEADSQVVVTTEVPQGGGQQAGEMQAVIQKLYDEGVISKTSGEYHALSDFNESIAQIDYLFTYPRDYEAENFVISSKVEWDSASDTANWPTSGCGFYYANENPDEFTLGATSLRLDGYGVIQQWVKGDGKILAKKNAGNIDVPKGDAELMLVVYDKRVTLYVNGSRIVSAYDGLVKLGTLGFTISSGTNAGFGTRCQMTNVNLWIFD
jgi:hypothetical protein